MIRTIKNNINIFLVGIKNLWVYGPIIWRTREWDYSYSLDLLEFKLNRTANYIEKHERFVGWEFVVRDIRLCVKLLNRFREEYYCVEYLNYYNSNINFEPCNDSKDRFKMVETNITENFQEYFDKYPRIYKQVIRDSEDSLDDLKLIAIKIAHINEERCKKLVFKILEEKIENWWD